MVAEKKKIEAKNREIEDQNGFRVVRSCVDNSFTLQQILEKRAARNLYTPLIVVDLKKSYDTVPLKSLFNLLTRTYVGAISVKKISRYVHYCFRSSLLKIKF